MSLSRALDTFPLETQEMFYTYLKLPEPLLRCFSYMTGQLDAVNFDNLISKINNRLQKFGA